MCLFFLLFFIIGLIILDYHPCRRAFLIGITKLWFDDNLAFTTGFLNFNWFNFDLKIIRINNWIRINY